MGPNGSTANDAGDADSGANRLQNSPDITADVSVNQISGSLANVTISYRVDTAPANATFPLVVEFFLSDATGTDAFFIGSDSYDTSDHSAGIKTITLTGVSIVCLLYTSPSPRDRG